MDDATVYYEPVIQYLNDKGLSIVDLINVLLVEKKYRTHPLTNNLLVNRGTVIQTLLGHNRLPEHALNAVCATIERIYAQEIEELIDGDNGFHFGAWQMIPSDIEDFGLVEMSKDYMKLVPRLWSLLDALLRAQKWRTSLLLAPVSVMEGVEENLPAGDRDEERLEGSRQ